MGIERICLCPNLFELRHGADHDRPRYLDLVIGGWWLGLEGVVPPPVGALAKGSGPRGHIGRGLGRWPGQRSRAEPSAGAVSDDEGVGGSGDGDDTAVMQPMVVRTYQHE